MKKLLIAEDEKALSEVLEDRFKEEGWTVVTAEDGNMALLALLADTFDLVLLDLLMPKKDGFEVLEEIRRNSVLSNLRIIVISVLGGDEDIKKAMRLGANDYFVKSEHPISEILEKVNAFTLTH